MKILQKPTPLSVPIQSTWRAKLSSLYGEQNYSVYMESKIIQSIWRAKLSSLSGEQNYPVYMESKIIQSIWRAKLSSLSGEQNPLNLNWAAGDESFI